MSGHRRPSAPGTEQDCAESFGIEQFEALQFDVARFDHRRHVYVGWLYLQQFDLRQTQRRYGKTLRRLTASLGAPEKYHQTMTYFLLALIATRREAAPGASWTTFVNANPDLLLNVRDTLLRYYSSRRLNSSTARRRYLPPDRRPLMDTANSVRSPSTSRSDATPVINPR